MAPSENRRHPQLGAKTITLISSLLLAIGVIAALFTFIAIHFWDHPYSVAAPVPRDDTNDTNDASEVPIAEAIVNYPIANSSTRSSAPTSTPRQKVKLLGRRILPTTTPLAKTTPTNSSSIIGNVTEPKQVTGHPIANDTTASSPSILVAAWEGVKSLFG